MAFISTPGPEAGDATAAMYVTAEESYGYLPNMYRVFGHRPEVMEKWGALLASVRGHMSLRRYELVTLAAARNSSAPIACWRTARCFFAKASARRSLPTRPPTAPMRPSMRLNGK